MAIIVQGCLSMAVFGPLAAFEPDNPALFTILVRID